MILLTDALLKNTMALSLRHPSSRCLLASQAKTSRKPEQGTIAAMQRNALPRDINAVDGRGGLEHSVYHRSRQPLAELLGRCQVILRYP